MKLRELPNTGVIINTEAELKEYLQICEDGGWVWGSGNKPTNPASVKPVPCYITARSYMTFGGVRSSGAQKQTLITLQQFKERQYIMKYSEGDVLVKGSMSRKILYIGGQLYFMSSQNKHDQYGRARTESELNAKGYTLKTDEPELVEKTVGEVEKEMGLPEGSLRIKD